MIPDNKHLSKQKLLHFNLAKQQIVGKTKMLNVTQYCICGNTYPYDSLPHQCVYVPRHQAFCTLFSLLSIKLLVAAGIVYSSIVKYLVPTPSVSIIMTRGRVAAMFSRHQIRVCPSVCFLNLEECRGNSCPSIKPASTQALLQIKKRKTHTGLFVRRQKPIYVNHGEKKNQPNNFSPFSNFCLELVIPKIIFLSVLQKSPIYKF